MKRETRNGERLGVTEELGVLWAAFSRFKAENSDLVEEVTGDMWYGYRRKYRNEVLLGMAEAALWFNFNMKEAEKLFRSANEVSSVLMGYTKEKRVLAQLVDIEGKRVILANIDNIYQQEPQFWFVAGLEYQNLRITGQSFSSYLSDRKLVDIAIIAAEECGHYYDNLDLFVDGPLMCEYVTLDKISTELAFDGLVQESKVYYHASEYEFKALVRKLNFVRQKFPSLVRFFGNHLQDVLDLRLSWEEAA